MKKLYIEVCDFVKEMLNRSGNPAKKRIFAAFIRDMVKLRNPSGGYQRYVINGAFEGANRKGWISRMVIVA